MHLLLSSHSGGLQCLHQREAVTKLLLSHRQAMHLFIGHRLYGTQYCLTPKTTADPPLLQACAVYILLLVAGTGDNWGHTLEAAAWLISDLGWASLQRGPKLRVKAREAMITVWSVLFSRLMPMSCKIESWAPFCCPSRTIHPGWSRLRFGVKILEN